MHFLARIAKLSKSTAYAEYSTSTADMAGFTVAGCELIVESKKPDKGEPIKNNRTYQDPKNKSGAILPKLCHQIGIYWCRSRI